MPQPEPLLTISTKINGGVEGSRCPPLSRAPHVLADAEAYTRLGQSLTSRPEFSMARLESRRLSASPLSDCDALLIFDLDPADLDGLRRFIKSGGGVVLGGERAIAILGSLGLTCRPAGVGRLNAGAGRLSLLGDTDWIEEVYWATMPAFHRGDGTNGSDAGTGDGMTGWADLRDAVNALRRLQSEDGSVADVDDQHDKAARILLEVEDGIEVIEPSFEHQSEYLDALRNDLHRWRNDDFGVPDFSRSLATLSPQHDRSDTTQHLIVMPMYTPNGSRSVRFEALLLRTIWPDWLERIWLESYGENTGFIPGALLDFTEGYASDCAVIFPETVSVGGPAPNEFGVLLCDREAVRYRAEVGAALDALRCETPQRLQALLASQDLAIRAYALWDLMHDTSHRRGELPFDPFLVRQRSPFWMYALEELRVDLRSYLDAYRMIEDFAFAEHVCYAVLLDRILRFPVTGDRRRNYDALGGQILFAALHHDGTLEWEDGKLVIEWGAVAESVMRLEAQLRDLYRRAQILPKPHYWAEAHDLISGYLKPNLASRWSAERRDFLDETDLGGLVDAVHDDEFPLGTFHLALKKLISQDQPNQPS